MSATFVDALYRLGKPDSNNEYAGNGITVNDMWASGEVGSTSSGDAYDDSWWVLSYGNYSTIDRIDLAGGTRVDQIAILYGDSRSNDSYYSTHDDVGTSDTRPLTVLPGVDITEVIACTGSYLLSTRIFYIKFVLSNGDSVDIGTSTSTCTTFTPPTDQRIVAFVGRAGSAINLFVVYSYT